MAARPEKSGQGTIAAAAAALMLAGIIAAPVFAAPDHELDGDEATLPNLDVSASELTASPNSSSEERLKHHLLKPRADSAVRTAFADEEAESEVEEEAAEKPVDALAEKPGLPRVSDGEPSPYKRQMYRRDI
jgi:hypothetical protein